MSSVNVSLLHERMGICVELLLFNDLVADQNCFVFGDLDKLLEMYCFFGFSEFFHSPVSEVLILLSREHLFSLAKLLLVYTVP